MYASHPETARRNPLMEPSLLLRRGQRPESVDYPLRQAQRREQTSQHATATVARCLACRHDLSSVREASFVVVRGRTSGNQTLHPGLTRLPHLMPLCSRGALSSTLTGAPPGSVLLVMESREHGIRARPTTVHIDAPARRSMSRRWNLRALPRLLPEPRGKADSCSRQLALWRLDREVNHVSEAASWTSAFGSGDGATGGGRPSTARPFARTRGG